MTRTKPPANRLKFLIFVNYTFRKNSRSVSTRDFSAIEWMIRQGTKQIEMYENPALRDCLLSREMVDWAEQSENRSRVNALERNKSGLDKVVIKEDDVLPSR